MGDWRRFEPAAVLAALLAAAALGSTLSSVRGSPAVDFYHFWLVPRVVERGESIDVYAPASRREIGERAHRDAHLASRSEAQRRSATKFRRLETTATPFLYASFAPFVGGDYDRDRIAYNAAGVAVFVLSVAALARALGYGATGTLALLAFLLVGFDPFTSDVRVGNVNRLQVGLLAAWVLLSWKASPRDRFRWLLAGVWLGLGVAWKPNLAFVAAAVSWFWWARGEKDRCGVHLAGLVLGGLAAVAVSSAFFGTASVWWWWLEAAARLPRDFSIALAEGNFAPLRVLEEGFGVRLGVVWPLALVVLVALVLRRAAVRGESRDAPGEEAILLAGIGGATSVLAAPLSWLHYYLLSTFLVLWVLRPDPPERPIPALYRVVAVLAVVAVSMGPALRLFVASEPYRWAGFGNGGLLVLLSLGLLDLGRVVREGSRVEVAAVAGPTAF